MRGVQSAVVLLLALPSALAGCTGDSPTTELRLTATNLVAGRAEFSVSCDPAGDDVPSVSDVCRRITDDPALVSDVKPYVCGGGPRSWWTLTLRGRLNGEKLEVTTDTCWTPQMLLIRTLGIAQSLDSHIVPNSQPAYPGSGISRADLATVVQIPREAPGWLVRIARLRARALGDETPARMLITLGNPYRIRLKGSFVCNFCHRPPGADGSALQGTHASLEIDPKTRSVLTFTLARPDADHRSEGDGP